MGARRHSWNKTTRGEDEQRGVRIQNSRCQACGWSRETATDFGGNWLRTRYRDVSGAVVCEQADGAGRYGHSAPGGVPTSLPPCPGPSARRQTEQAARMLSVLEADSVCAALGTEALRAVVAVLAVAGAKLP